MGEVRHSDDAFVSFGAVKWNSTGFVKDGVCVSMCGNLESHFKVCETIHIGRSIDYSNSAFLRMVVCQAGTAAKRLLQPVQLQNYPVLKPSTVSFSRPCSVFNNSLFAMSCRSSLCTQVFVGQ